jgi:hypothetical protein
VIALFTASPLMQSIGAIGLGLFYLVSTLLAVPKAATAFSAGNKAPKLPLFFGVGAGFISILLVSIAGTAVMFYSGAVGQMLNLFLHVVELAKAAIDGATLPWKTQREYAVIGGAILLYIWTHCWWYAVGGLAFLKRHEKAEHRSANARGVPVKHEMDLTELRLSRMQKDLGRTGE